jgi:hypothetical protein
MTTFITQQKRAKTRFEQRYLKLYGNVQERRIDLPGLSPALIQKRQELEHAQQQLAAERLDYERWLKEHQQRKVDIEQKRNEFETEERARMQIKKRMKDEIARFKALSEKEYELFVKYEKQLAALNAKEEGIRVKLIEYQQQLDLLQPSAIFLEKVVGETKIFESIDAIIHRYETLMASKRDWTVELSSHLASPGQILGPRARIAHIQSVLLDKRHELRALREEIAKLKQQERYAHVLLMKNAEREIEKEAEEATVYSSIENMCRQTLINQGKETGKDSGTEVPASMEEQLEIIKQRFLDLQAVISDPEIVFASPIEVKESGKISAKSPVTGSTSPAGSRPQIPAKARTSRLEL